MIYSLEGPMGTGKTLTGVAICAQDYWDEEKRIITNCHLNDVPYTHFTLEYFLENMISGEIENCSLFLDELYQIMDCRLSTQKITRIMTYFIVQTRKRDVDFYFSTHRLENVEVRLRNAVDIRGACSMYYEDPCKKCKGAKVLKSGETCDRCMGWGKTGTATTHFLQMRKRGQARRRFSLDVFGPKYWGLYDTKERIPIQASLLKGIDTLEVV